MPRENADSARRPLKKSAPGSDPAERGPWRELGITFGCVAVAFAGILIFVTSLAPTGDPQTPLASDGKPNPSPVEPGPDANPGDWTPPAWSRPVVDVSPGRKLTATPTADVQPLRGVAVVRAAYLDEPRLLFVQGRDQFETLGDVRFLDVTTGKPLPLPELTRRAAILTTLAASPDQTALFIHEGDALHRFDVGRREWESAPLAPVNGVTVVSADRVLVVRARPNAGPKFQLLKWEGPRKPLLVVAEHTYADKPTNIGNGGALHAYDPATGTAYLLHPRTAGVGLLRYRLGAREFAPTQSDVLTMPPPSRLTLSWDGTRLYAGHQTIDLATNMVTNRRFARSVTAAVPLAFLDESNHFFKTETEAAVPMPWDEGPSRVFVSTSGTACWVSSSKPGGYDFTCYSLGTAPAAGPAIPPVAKPPVNPFPYMKVTQLATLPCPDKQFTAFRYSDRHNLLLFSELAGTTILDTKTGEPLPQPTLEGKLRLRSADLSPDQTAVFASDGQNLHRLDLATRKWETRPNVGQRVLAIDGATALVHVKVSNPATYALVRWGTADVTELDRMEWRAPYDLGYDPAAKVLYAIHANANRVAQLERYAIEEKGFRSEWTRNLPGLFPSRVTLRPLTGDGTYFACGQQGVATARDGAVTNYPEQLFGTTHSALVGVSGKLYAAGNVPAVVGALPHRADAVASSADGRTIWVADRTGRKFVHYRLEPSAGKK